jgi:hypothetical protein
MENDADERPWPVGRRHLTSARTARGRDLFASSFRDALDELSDKATLSPRADVRDTAWWAVEGAMARLADDGMRPPRAMPSPRRGCHAAPSTMFTDGDTSEPGKKKPVDPFQRGQGIPSTSILRHSPRLGAPPGQPSCAPLPTKWCADTVNPGSLFTKAPGFIGGELREPPTCFTLVPEDRPLWDGTPKNASYFSDVVKHEHPCPEITSTPTASPRKHPRSPRRTPCPANKEEPASPRALRRSPRVTPRSRASPRRVRRVAADSPLSTPTTRPVSVAFEITRGIGRILTPAIGVPLAAADAI